MYTIGVEALEDRLLELWLAYHAESELELGPLLHPGYVRAVASVRSDVEVGVIERDGEVRGFFPYQRSGFDVARPVGGRFCGQSGAVLASGASWDPVELARRVGLRAIRLRLTSVSDPGLRPYQAAIVTAPFLDLSDGYDAYRDASLATGSRLMRQIERRTRRAEHELGPLRFEWHTHNRFVLETLLAWKSAQRRASRTSNVLDLPWARAFAERLKEGGDRSFGGVLSALWFGDTLAAAQLGIRSRRVLHYMITAYDPRIGRYSPGLACLLSVARVGASEEGIERIELGAGDERFKQRASTDAKRLADATVTLGSAAAAAFRTADGARAWSRASRVGRWFRAGSRTLRRGSYAARSFLG